MTYCREDTGRRQDAQKLGADWVEGHKSHHGDGRWSTAREACLGITDWVCGVLIWALDIRGAVFGGKSVSRANERPVCMFHVCPNPTSKPTTPIREL